MDLNWLSSNGSLKVKNPGPKDLALNHRQKGLLTSYFHAAVFWSDGVRQKLKFQAPNLRVSGVGCQVSGETSMGHRAWSIGYKHFEIRISKFEIIIAET